MIKALYGYEDVSRRLWITSFFFILLGLCFIVASLIWHIFFAPLGLFASLGLWMIYKGYDTEIPANPPHVGLLTIWKKRVAVMIREGMWFSANYFPFNIWFIPILIELSNYEVEFDALCKAETLSTDDPNQVKNSIGGKVNVKLAITLAPDHDAKDAGKRLIQFLNAGGLAGAINILTDVSKEETRDIALGFTWEHFAKLKNVLSAFLISLITDMKVARLPRGANGKALSIKQLKEAPHNVTPETYGTLTPITDLLEEYVAAMGIEGGNGDEEARKLLDADILYFLNVIVTSGLADVRDLGINITKLNITHIFPVGAIAAAADAAAAERQERTKEERDTDTDLILAQKYVEKSRPEPDKPPTMTLDAALRIVRVNKGRAHEVIITGGTGNPITDAAALVNAPKS